MAYDFKKLSDVAVVETLADTANVLIEEDGVIKKVAKGEVGGVQPDWNQNDETAPDYVKNRPFWTDDPVEDVLFDEVVPSEVSGRIVELAVGQEYNVTLDGVEYVLTAWDNGADCIIIGSQSMWNDPDYVDTELPFLLANFPDEDGGVFYTINDGDQHDLKVEGVVAKVNKIDEKYIPSIGTKLNVLHITDDQETEIKKLEY